MTLIAGFLRDGCPILMGDLLVSDTDKSDKEFVFPTVGEVSKNDFRNGNFSPSHLCQKIAIIGPKLAICWANQKIYAKRFVNAIIEANAHNTPSRELLTNIYNEIGGQEKLSIIGLFRNQGEMSMFGLGTSSVDPPLDSGYSFFRAIGSGCQILQDTIIQTHVDDHTVNWPILEKGIATAIGFISVLLSQEILFRISLHMLFGVGYEIVHPIDYDLAKFSKLTYVFWKAEEVGSGTWIMQPFPFLTFNYSYSGDILIIRSMRASSVPNANSCKIDSDELHVIAPLHRPINLDELKGYTPMSFNSEWICNVFLWKNRQGYMGSCVNVSQYPKQSTPIIWTNEFSNNRGINVNTKFIASSISEVTRAAENSGSDSK